MSVWEPPAEGYVSIKEQEEEFERLKHIENVKVRIKLELLKTLHEHDASSFILRQINRI